MKLCHFHINGKNISTYANPKDTMLFVLRNALQLTGTKCGCDSGTCGACKILLDGVAVRSCKLLVENVLNKKIVTIEGLSKNGILHPIQQAFIDAGAVQCGYCTPGMIITTQSLLNKNSYPNEEDIRHAFRGNICRCTGYVKIIEAVLLAASRMGGKQNCIE